MCIVNSGIPGYWIYSRSKKYSTTTTICLLHTVSTQYLHSRAAAVCHAALRPWHLLLLPTYLIVLSNYTHGICIQSKVLHACMHTVLYPRDIYGKLINVPMPRGCRSEQTFSSMTLHAVYSVLLAGYDTLY